MASSSFVNPSGTVLSESEDLNSLKVIGSSYQVQSKIGNIILAGK
jgi:hypothetical protein